MSSEPPIVQLRLCPHCGAACELRAAACWMCTGPLPAVQPGRRAPVPVSSRLDGVFYVLLALCVGLTLLVGIGIAQEDPGALVGFLVLVSPAFAVTGVRALWQVQQTGTAQPGSLVLSFVMSIVMTIAVVAILAVAAAILLFMTCLQVISGG